MYFLHVAKIYRFSPHFVERISCTLFSSNLSCAAMNTQHIQHKLKNEYARRQGVNERYSIRSYAKYLGIDHSLLSKVLKNQQDLSTNQMIKIAPKLGLSLTDIKSIIKDKKLTTQSNISDDALMVISDWFYFAILEVLKLPDVEKTCLGISRALNLREMQVYQALDLLQRLGFITFDENDHIVAVKDNNFSYDFTGTNDFRKNSQKQLLFKAIEAVDEVDFSQRVNSTLTIAIDSSELPLYKQKIKNFIDELNQMSEKTPYPKDVYQLCIALFPFTTKGDH
jgi:DNA-binding transcriptional MerR regulator